jgi:hypothetical protein
MPVPGDVMQVQNQGLLLPSTLTPMFFYPFPRQQQQVPDTWVDIEEVIFVDVDETTKDEKKELVEIHHKSAAGKESAGGATFAVGPNLVAKCKEIKAIRRQGGVVKGKIYYNKNDGVTRISSTDRA